MPSVKRTSCSPVCSSEIPGAEPSRSVALPAWAAAVAALVAVALGLHVGSDWLAGLGRESPVGLVDERGVVLGLLSEAVFYMLREGASMLESILTTFVLPGLIVLGGLVAFSLRRRWVGGTLVLTALLALATPSSALEVRSARSEHDRVVVGAGETVDDSLVATGDTVAVDGTITGNLIAAGRRVIVRGTVKGDLLAVGERVEIEGTVEGNVFAGGDTVLVRGSVGRSVHGGGTHDPSRSLRARGGGSARLRRKRRSRRSRGARPRHLRRPDERARRRGSRRLGPHAPPASRSSSDDRRQPGDAGPRGRRPAGGLGSGRLGEDRDAARCRRRRVVTPGRASTCGSWSG